MKNIKKISIVLVMAFVCVCILQNVALATDMKSSISTLYTAPGDTNLNSSAQNIVGSIIAVVRVIAVGVAIIMLVTLAMKYMMAAPGEKADIKKGATIYIVGAIVLFATSGILGIIADFAGQIS